MNISIFTTRVGLGWNRPPQRFIVMTCSVCTSVSGLGTLAVRPPTPFCGHNSAARLAALSRISCHQNTIKKTWGGYSTNISEVVIYCYYFYIGIVPEVVIYIWFSCILKQQDLRLFCLSNFLCWDSWLSDLPHRVSWGLRLAVWARKAEENFPSRFHMIFPSIESIAPCQCSMIHTYALLYTFFSI